MTKVNSQQTTGLRVLNRGGNIQVNDGIAEIPGFIKTEPVSVRERHGLVLRTYEFTDELTGISSRVEVFGGREAAFDTWKYLNGKLNTDRTLDDTLFNVTGKPVYKDNRVPSLEDLQAYQITGQTVVLQNRLGADANLGTSFESTDSSRLIPDGLSAKLVRITGKTVHLTGLEGKGGLSTGNPNDGITSVPYRTLASLNPNASVFVLANNNN